MKESVREGDGGVGVYVRNAGTHARTVTFLKPQSCLGLRINMGWKIKPPKYARADPTLNL